ncbi:MAG: alpha/beta fold hydrolase [Flavobacteriaceae bacterium]|nr:alpha/beta fold hydrolase [Flavobacteriaceae bacterium]
MNRLITYNLKKYTTYSGIQYENLDTTYQVFGKKLHTAPVVVVNHALTGNSDLLSKKKGWWNEIVGKNKVINTDKYTVVAFNIHGNGYQAKSIKNYNDFTAKDIAAIFNLVLNEMGVTELYAVIGGSLGGGIAWEMAALQPSFIKYLIPIASDWKSTDWIIGHNYVQDQLLKNSKNPLQDARKMAMLFYRTPKSFTQKFNRTKTASNKQFNVESWLDHHGEKLKNRFDINAYLMMNHLLTTVDITTEKLSFEEIVKPIKSTIVQIAVDSDLFFVKEENIKTKLLLNELKIKNQYREIKSIHGHDAFLIEHEQLTQFLKPIFK